VADQPFSKSRNVIIGESVSAMHCQPTTYGDDVRGRWLFRTAATEPWLRGRATAGTCGGGQPSREASTPTAVLASTFVKAIHGFDIYISFAPFLFRLPLPSGFA
jgi:hypothetical protein